MSVEKFKQRCIKVWDRMSELDKLVSLAYHKIEFEADTDRKLLSEVKKLKKILLARRKNKDEWNKVHNFIGKVHNIKDFRIVKPNEVLLKKVI